MYDKLLFVSSGEIHDGFRTTPYNSAGEVEGVKYDRVAMVLINAIKEQQAQIEDFLYTHDKAPGRPLF